MRKGVRQMIIPLTSSGDVRARAPMVRNRSVENRTNYEGLSREDLRTACGLALAQPRLPERDGAEVPALDRDDERRRLLAEVEALPPECRTVVMLYYYENVTYRELAETLGVSPATINARLTKARALLRARLSPAWR